MVAALTRSWNLEGHTGRVPRANACHLAQTTMALADQASDTPSGHHTVETLALGGTNHIDHLILTEAISNLHLLLEQARDEIHLGLCGAAVHLNLLDVGLLRSNLCLADLSVANSTDHLAVLLGPVNLSLHRIAILAGFTPSLLVLGEGLLLGGVPSLVEATLAFLRKVTCPNGSQGAETSGSLNVAHEANHNHGRALQDGDRLDNLFLVQLGARPVHLSDNVSHACLVAHEGRQMRGFGLVIFREALDLAVMVLGPLPGQEAQGTMAWTLKLAMRHG
mmetsp:Transcript_9854/g.11946  ORF Transcript_9854/g.11946 Transcript_9854/m.11946 type:complete len:278 (+) Transcript_9854:406-1239(+)